MENYIFWIITLIIIFNMTLLIGFIYFGYQLYRINLVNNGMIGCLDFIYERFNDSHLVASTFEEYINRRNDFWTLFGQFVISTFLVSCITILLLTGVISAEAGLPILSAIGGFAISKGVSGLKSTVNHSRNNE